MPCSMQIVAARSAAYSLPIPPKSISMPSRGSRIDRSLHSTPPQPTSAIAAARAWASGRRGGVRRKSQARRSAPDVRSKSPPLWAKQRSA